MPIIKRYDRDFFKVWSPDMSYVVGFLYADGNLVKTERNTHFIAFYTADKELLEQMREVFGSNHMVSERASVTGKVFRLQIGSKVWFTDLYKIGLTPGKTLRMQLPRIPKKYFGDFLRGYFDGDGNVWSGLIHKGRNSPTMTIQVAFTSGSHNFLVDLHKLLNDYGYVEGGSIYASKTRNYSRLSFSKQDALKIYKIMYNAEHKLFLPRKKQVFEKFEKLRP